MSDVKIVELSSYSYTKPTIVEDKKFDFIGYGEDNDYPQFLIDRMNGSPTHGAIVNAISDLVFGNGLAATDASRKPDDWAKVISMLSDEDLKNVCYDRKLFGMAYFQVIRGKGGEWSKIAHLPFSNVRSGKCNEDGEIEAYYYASDWDKVAAKKVDPKRIPSFFYAKQTDTMAVYCIKSYSPDNYYYSPPDYQGGIQYAELEEEISNYHINNIRNGFAPSMLINFNNGRPDDEKQREIERRIQEKFTGSSNAGRFILAFNDPEDVPATLDTVQLSDAHNQYQFLSEEAQAKILVSHRITSPMLLGIKDNTGLGNNADELRTAFLMFDNTVIRPFQNSILKALKDIFAEVGIALDFYFKTLEPIEFTEVDKAQTVDEVAKETGVDMCSHVALSEDYDAEKDAEIADGLIDLGDSDFDEWELLDEEEAEDSHEAEDAYLEAVRKANEKAIKDGQGLLSKIWNFVSTGTARPNAKSGQDDKTEEYLFKVRYEYAPNKVGTNSREFCKKMVKAGKLYRKEDIEQMSDKVVNAGFGPYGADTYDIWLYKGGKLCSHRWVRKTFIKKGATGNIDVNSPRAKTTSITDAKRKGYDIEDPTYKTAKTRPRDMPNQGGLQ